MQTPSWLRHPSSYRTHLCPAKTHENPLHPTRNPKPNIHPSPHLRETHIQLRPWRGRLPRLRVHTPTSCHSAGLRWVRRRPCWVVLCRVYSDLLISHPSCVGLTIASQHWDLDSAVEFQGDCAFLNADTSNESFRGDHGCAVWSDEVERSDDLGRVKDVSECASAGYEGVCV